MDDNRNFGGEDASEEDAHEDVIFKINPCCAHELSIAS